MRHDTIIRFRELTGDLERDLVIIEEFLNDSPIFHFPTRFVRFKRFIKSLWMKKKN